jgi:hypothetical protein
MRHYKIMKQKVSEDQLSEFIYEYMYIHLYSHYIKVYIYFFAKFHTFGFILKRYATATTDMHFSSQYMITKLCLTCARSLYTALTSIWCPEIKHNHRS